MSHDVVVAVVLLVVSVVSLVCKTLCIWTLMVFVSHGFLWTLMLFVCLCSCCLNCTAVSPPAKTFESYVGPVVNIGVLTPMHQTQAPLHLQ